MKWINFLIDSNIQYYIYKLDLEDAIILNKNNSNKNKLFTVLNGSILVTKIFYNNEIIPIAILNNNNIFTIKNLSDRYYYQIKALEKTYIITFTLQKIFTKKNRTNLLVHIIENYQKTIHHYEVMNEIINQKYAKLRILQLIFILCLEFGRIEQKKIFLPMKLSYHNLAIISGTNKTTVSKIIREMHKNKVIKYSNKYKIYINNIFNIKFR
uniref:Global nitrogen transcriptional regulator n=1 Tax=Lophocladia kuetzingii TaxID=675577 RepID=A0A1Z1MNW1_9FLOR|nr:global nitrogen transcriptional regulator [Lophocladia kuetzingii]ARW67748.1 global nitrogen transcriptional regulator [Lophocladia kuetzingii]